MKKMMMIGIVAMLVVFASAPAQAGVTTNEKVPFSGIVFISCALDGAGEYVKLEGELHVLASVTTSKSGMTHVAYHSQPMGVSGIGQTSGDKYQGTGVTRSDFSMDTNDDFPYQYTYVNNFRIIGPGPGNNYTIHQTMHITINANGVVTAEVNNLKAECK